MSDKTKQSYDVNDVVDEWRDSPTEPYIVKECFEDGEEYWVLVCRATGNQSWPSYDSPFRPGYHPEARILKDGQSAFVWVAGRWLPGDEKETICL